MISYGTDSPGILGVMEIGVFLSLVFFGMVALQGYVYFHNCKADRSGLKWLAGSVLFFELCHSIASCHAIYYFTVIEAGIPELEHKSNSYSLALTPVFETIITALVQAFFAYRIRILSGRIHISVVCWTLCVLRFIGGMGVAVVTFLDVPREPNGFQVQAQYGWLITLTLNVGVVVDILVTAALCLYIRQLCTRHSLPKGEELIHRLVVWTIQTGLITSFTSVVVVITFQTMKHNFVWLALYTFLAKLYSNSLFVSLNGRPRNREIIRASSPKTPPSTLDTLTIHVMQTTEVEGPASIAPPPGLLKPEKVVYNTMSYRAV